MNWDLIADYYNRAISKEMPVKEASDFLTVSQYLIRFAQKWQDVLGYSDEEIDNLKKLSLAVFLRMCDRNKE